jgi:uncharacterized protein (DUF2237 family)
MDSTPRAYRIGLVAAAWLFLRADSHAPAVRSATGGPLAVCSTAPLTGYWRDGSCHTGPEDRGVHVVCAEVSDAFLAFTRERGNDLVTPRGSFSGLQAGDRWCLCASRWREALHAGVAPPVVLEATNEAALRFVTLDELRQHAGR